MSDRMIRISEEVKRALSELIRKELKDPRLPAVVSLTHVKVAKDMKTCKVYVSVFGSEEEKQNAIVALKSAAGFLRREIGRRLLIRATPELFFYLDESIAKGMQMSKLIDEVMESTKQTNENTDLEEDI